MIEYVVRNLNCQAVVYERDRLKGRIGPNVEKLITKSQSINWENKPNCSTPFNLLIIPVAYSIDPGKGSYTLRKAVSRAQGRRDQ